MGKQVNALLLGLTSAKFDPIEFVFHFPNMQLGECVREFTVANGVGKVVCLDVHVDGETFIAVVLRQDDQRTLRNVNFK